MNLVGQAALLVSFPVAAAIIGAVVAAYRPPGPRIVSGVQHFAAGVVMAALVGEIMPELAREGRLWWTVVGFVAGAGLVLALGAYGRRTEAVAEVREREREESEARDHVLAEAAARAGVREAPRGHLRRNAVTAALAATLPIGMLGAMAVDLLLDGVLVGVGVQLGSSQGLILTIALTLEILFLGLSVVSELTGRGVSRGRAVLYCSGLGLMTAVGAIGGAVLLGNVSPSVMSAVLAFGAAALLYLVVEELLVEAHEERESVALGAMFFLGFLLIYVLAALGAGEGGHG